MKTRTLAGAFLAAVGLWAPEAAAGPGDPVGSAVRVLNQVTAEDGAAARSLAQGDGVKQDEIIAVGTDSLGEIRLLDETKLALGPGARLKLDKFVYDASQATGSVAVDLTKGAFRFITGIAKKPSYLIRSPSASISVRGTIFDVYVEANGTMWVLLHEGSIEVCNAASVCRVIENPCGMVRVGPGGELSDTATWNRQPAVREIDFETAFPFVVRPPQIDPAPRYTRANVEAGTCVADIIPPPERPRRADLPAPVAPGGPVAPPTLPPVATAPPAVEPETYEEPFTPAPPTGADVAAASRSWTGIYVGVSLGGGRMQGDTHVGCDDPAGIFDTVFNTPDCAFPIQSGALETNYSTDSGGFVGGAQAGYNLQTGNIVIGLETDISATTFDGKDTEFRDVPPTSPGVRRLSQELEWLSTVRARLGFVSGNWLLFGTAGLAFGEVHYSYEAEYSGGVAFARFSETEIEVGWTAGLGAEVALGQWTLKGEYLYYDLGEADFSTQFFQLGVPVDVYFEPEFENQGHIGRIGLNLRLN